MNRLFWRTVVARAYPRVLGFYRRPSWLFMELAVPVVGTLAMVYVYRGLGAPQRFLGFVVLGGAMLAFWQNVLWSMAMQLYWDRDGGNLELYVMAPTTLVPVSLGMAFGAVVPTALRAAVVIVFGSIAFQVHYVSGALLPAVGVFALTLACLYGMGMTLGSVFLFYGRDAWHMATALQEPVYLLSGLYFPVRTLGAFAAIGAAVIPMALGLDAMRQLLLPGSAAFLALGAEVAILAAQFVIFAVTARLGLTIMERLARRDGRLVSRAT
jgi:ABC-2 type transport system permease protein